MEKKNEWIEKFNWPAHILLHDEILIVAAPLIAPPPIAGHYYIDFAPVLAAAAAATTHSFWQRALTHIMHFFREIEGAPM